MTIHFELLPLLAIAAGAVILIVPKLHRFVVAGYLIAIGVIQIL